MDFAHTSSALLARIETALDRHLPPADTRPARLHTAMRYSLQAGGKRIRPVLCLAAATLRSADSLEKALPAAVALECIHTYSLIHDDLPCMDNDDLRRGRPTCHKAFDEATALLAGDALLTHAFALLGKHYAAEPALATALLSELASAAGSTRLIGGQIEDLQAERKANATADELDFIHLNKTAAMIEASLVMGGLVAGENAAALELLRTTGRHLGLAFQIIDDILDVTADTATLGKTAGKDLAAEKTTYVKLHGLDRARHLAAQQTQSALAAVAQLPGDSAFLRALVESLLLRKN